MDRNIGYTSSEITQTGAVVTATEADLRANTSSKVLGAVYAHKRLHCAWRNLPPDARSRELRSSLSCVRWYFSLGVLLEAFPAHAVRSRL